MEKNFKTKIIAEIGVNHGGSIKKAFKLINVAKKAGADVAKFQFFNTTSLVSKKAHKAPYQKRSRSDKDTQYKLLKPLEFNINNFKKIKNFCKKKKIDFMISIFDETGIKAIKKLKLKDIKIPSGEINNYPLLRQVGKLKKNVILSTGMSTYKEVKNAIDILIKNGTIKNNITVLQCNSSYPSPHKDANLKVMKEYEKKFGIKAGYSDHTPGIESSMAAVALGAKIIEKHFTLSKRSKGPDHSSSLSPKEFSLLTKSIRKVTESLGNRDKKITKSERQNVKIVRKSIVAKTFISKGEKFNSNNITVKRPAGGLGPEKWDQIKGKIAKKNFKEDEFIKI